jgi:Domain of unknown function (DUF4112)
MMAVMVVKTCQQIEGGLPSKVTTQMYSTIVLDFGIGLVLSSGTWRTSCSEPTREMQLSSKITSMGEELVKSQGEKMARNGGRIQAMLG